MVLDLGSEGPGLKPLGRQPLTPDYHKKSNKNSQPDLSMALKRLTFKGHNIKIKKVKFMLTNCTYGGL